MIFLEAMPNFEQMFADPTFKDVFVGSMFGGLAGFLFGIAILFALIILIAWYVYMALVWSTIAKN